MIIIYLCVLIKYHFSWRFHHYHTHSHHVSLSVAGQMEWIQKFSSLYIYYSFSLFFMMMMKKRIQIRNIVFFVETISLFIVYKFFFFQKHFSQVKTPIVLETHISKS